MLRFAILVTVMLLAAPAIALELGLPIACDVGKDCFIQNYVDRDPGSDAADYTCGRLAYNGHKGTDFRLRNLAQMKRGVAVIAAAPGTVKATRDAMPDQLYSENSKGSVTDRECGNGVLIVTDDGYDTQYCHMKRGSIVVKPGERVRDGQKLGEVGLSGMTQFPHVHLEVRKSGTIIDPFIGETASAGCNVARKPLWKPGVMAQLAYVRTGFLGGGFTAETPNVPAIRAGLPERQSMPATASVMVFWIDMFGAQAGDVLRLRMLEPSGTEMAAHTETFAKGKAQYTGFIGKKNKAGAFAKGTYRGEAVLTRDGKEALRLERTVRVD